MTNLFYPYRDVFWKGMSLYFKGLRAFVADRLQQRGGIEAQAMIRRSLYSSGKTIFEDNLEATRGDWKSALDIVHLAPIIQAHWQDLFSLEFQGIEPIPKHLGKLTEARNLYAHDLTGDMNRAYVRNCLNLMGKVLLAIGRRDLYTQIQDVSGQLGGSSIKEGQGLLQLTLAPIALNQLLREWYWERLAPKFHVSVETLWRDMEKGQRKHRAGLQCRQELQDSLAQGIADRVFGRADGYDPDTGSYRGLTLGLDHPLAVFLPQLVTGETLIVNADWAEMHLDGKESLYAHSR